jgi:hypothetical protein
MKVLGLQKLRFSGISIFEAAIGIKYAWDVAMYPKPSPPLT